MKKILMTLTLALAAAIAIPATAQSTTTSTCQTKECCKEKKACAKEGTSCAKEAGKTCDKGEGKACCKDGNAHHQKMKGCKHAKGDCKMKGQKDVRLGKDRRRNGGDNPMWKGITLTEDQKTKVRALHEKNKTAEKQSKAEMKAKSKDEMQKIRADFDKEIEKILDKDQLKQYKANKAEMEARRAEKKNK